MSDESRRRLLIAGGVGVFLIAGLLAFLIGGSGDAPGGRVAGQVPADAAMADALDPAARAAIADAKAAGVKAAQGPGRLIVVTAPPGAEVILKDRKPQSAPARFVDLPPGVYEVTVRKDGYRSVQRSVTVQAGQAEDLIVALEPEPGTP